MITYTNISVLDEDNCFLIVSLVIMIKTKHKNLHSEEHMHCGLKTTFT